MNSLRTVWFSLGYQTLFGFLFDQFSFNLVALSGFKEQKINSSMNKMKRYKSTVDENDEWLFATLYTSVCTLRLLGKVTSKAPPLDYPPRLPTMALWVALPNTVWKSHYEYWIILFSGTVISPLCWIVNR